MATLFRPIIVRWVKGGKRVPPRTPGARKTREPGPNWHGRYLDADGAPKRVKLTRDKQASRDMLQELEVDARRGQLHLPARRRPPAGLELKDARARFIAHLEAKGDTAKHVVEVRNQLEKTAGLLGWASLEEVSGEALASHLAVLRSTGLSARRSNHYLGTWRAFLRWAVRNGLTHNSTLERLTPINPETDRRRIRRALSAPELSGVLRAAKSSKIRLQGLAGLARYRLYLFAALTGLRAGELRSLTAESLDLKHKPPTVTVEARHSKRRRRDTLPLHPALVAELKAWKPAGRLWPGEWRGAELLTADLAAAKIQAGSGVLDFHSLRATFATTLAKQGVPLAVAQKLMRHSTPALTAKHYVSLDAGELGEWLHSVTLGGLKRREKPWKPEQRSKGKKRGK